MIKEIELAKVIKKEDIDSYYHGPNEVELEEIITKKEREHDKLLDYIREDLI